MRGGGGGAGVGGDTVREEKKIFAIILNSILRKIGTTIFCNNYFGYKED